MITSMNRYFWACLAGAAWWLQIGFLVGAPAEPSPKPFAQWEKEIAAFEAADKTNPPPQGAILFVGSSSIRLWKTLARDFPGHQVINRGFGGSQITDSVHFAGRVVVHPSGWLKTSVAYKYVRAIYRTDTDPVSESVLNDISPGGALRSADYRAHVASFNATVAPWQRLYLSGTFSYENNRIATFDHRSDSTVPYAGDVFSVLASATFVVTTNTDWTTTYNFSYADYAQDNFAAGLPLGVRYHRHGVTTGLAHRFGANASAKVQYGFYDYEEPTSHGHNDYLAHAVFATLVWRFP